MSYRVETASSARAVCKAKECKDAGVKIGHGELRLGTWVPFDDHGSWHWKHWGCVTGAQIKNMRDYLANPATGGYNWDALDGYDGDDKNSLSHAPDLQDKVRKAIEQGHVDDEDFNGDLEMNKLGEKGLRTTANKRKILEAQRNRDDEFDELLEKNAALEAQLLANNGGVAPAKKKAASKKRARGDDDEDVKPAKKSRVKKGVKKEEGDSEDDGFDMLDDLEASLKQDPDEVKPAKKSRGKKAVKKEESEELNDVDVKGENNDDEAEVMPAPSRRSRAKKAVKKEEAQDNELVKDEQVDELPLPPQKKSARGKKAVKKEPVKRGGRKAAKKEVDEDAVMADIPDIMDEVIKDESVKNEEFKDGVKDEVNGEPYRRYPEDHVKDELKHGLYPYDALGEAADGAVLPSSPPSAVDRAPKKEKAAPKASTSTRATRSRSSKK